MTTLLELREKCKLFFSQNEIFIIPAVKFLLALLTVLSINGQLGYMKRIDNIAVVLIVALLCSFLPTGFIVFFGALFSLLHMYALSMEVALVGASIYLVMVLVFLRFSSREALLVVLTPLLFFLRIPYIVPVAAGLVGGPATAVAACCGVVVYYLIHIVAENATTIGTMGSDEAIAKVRIVLDALLENKAMLIVLLSFLITVLVVYAVRRLSVEYSWTIAMVAGVITNLVILLIGDLIYDTNISVIGVILGSVLALVLGKLLELFRFCVDYGRTEKVQFEDDEYYYYVKAVPKLNMAAPAKTVKRINTPRKQEGGAYRERKPAQSGGRSVTTVRTGQGAPGGGGRAQEPGRGGRQASDYLYRNGRSTRRKSVSVNTRTTMEDDYEEL